MYIFVYIHTHGRDLWLASRVHILVLLCAYILKETNTYVVYVYTVYCTHQKSTAPPGSLEKLLRKMLFVTFEPQGAYTPLYSRVEKLKKKTLWTYAASTWPTYDGVVDAMMIIRAVYIYIHICTYMLSCTPHRAPRIRYSVYYL